MASVLVGAPMTLRATFVGDDEETGIASEEPVVVIAGGANFVAEATDTVGEYVVRDLPAPLLPGVMLVTWDAIIDGVTRTITQTVRVRARRIMTVAEARTSATELEDRDRYPSSLIVEHLDLVQDEFERILGFELTPLVPSPYLPTGEIPADLLWAARVRLASLILSMGSGIPDRATSFTAPEGGTYALAIAGRGGYETGIPDVDAILKRYARARIGIA